MKTLTFLLCWCLALLPACMAASGNGSSWRVAALGTDISGLDVSAAGIKAARINNSNAFKAALTEVRKMWGSYLMAQGLRFVAGRYYDHQGKLTDAATTEKLELLRNARSKDEAAAALERLKLFPPEPLVSA
jgi:hypothetical protein